jgi:Protein of unknown function (DUF1569)
MKTLARESDIAEILQRVGRLAPECERQWGRMSVHQTVCHLSDACRMALGETSASSTGGIAQRTIVKWIALYAPLKWPPGILTRPEIDQEVSGTKPTSFAADIADLEALVRRVAAHKRWPSHPIFGRMSHAEWLRWGYLHLDHHLRQFGR